MLLDVCFLGSNDEVIRACRRTKYAALSAYKWVTKVRKKGAVVLLRAKAKKTSTPSSPSSSQRPAPSVPVHLWWKQKTTENVCQREKVVSLTRMNALTRRRAEGTENINYCFVLNAGRKPLWFLHNRQKQTRSKYLNREKSAICPQNCLTRKINQTLCFTKLWWSYECNFFDPTLIPESQEKIKSKATGFV